MSHLPPTRYNDTRVRVGSIFMIGLGLLMAAGYVLLAVSNDLPGLLAGVPVALVGVLCIYLSHRRWVGATGESGGGGLWMVLGCVLIIGSLWAAFMTAGAAAG